MNIRCYLAVLVTATAIVGAAEPDRRISDDRLAAWADARVKDWQPRPAERRIDEIGWARDILTARALSKQHNRPVFLFTMDGRITIGRC
jgi:hypothetical protein